ncbi:Hypothetical_protein [Hexamita inflata]|uniref:Hypothetical_protein n=1 Tax=Hexamita inflata TaxID=28002 RepID=A0AA86NCL5_9EUKA|nr:Hypothetical protein HINF_LOCUS4498 [Hexamita inflata]
MMKDTKENEPFLLPQKSFKENTIQVPAFNSGSNRYQISKKQETWLLSILIISLFIPPLSWCYTCFLVPTRKILPKYFVISMLFTLCWIFVSIAIIGYCIIYQLYIK